DVHHVMRLEGTVSHAPPAAAHEIDGLALVREAARRSARLELDAVHRAKVRACAGPGDRDGTSTGLDDVERLAAAQNREIRSGNGLRGLRHGPILEDGAIGGPDAVDV